MLRGLNLAQLHGINVFKIGIAGNQYAALGGNTPTKPIYYTFNEQGITSERKFRSLKEGLAYFAVNAKELQ